MYYIQAVSINNQVKLELRSIKIFGFLNYNMVYDVLGKDFRRLLFEFLKYTFLENYALIALHTYIYIFKFKSRIYIIL